KELVDQHYPHVEKICLVLDNLNTHTKAALYEAFDPLEAKRIADKLAVHYTPKHGSWLNMAEIELSHLSRQCLRGRIAAKGRSYEFGDRAKPNKVSKRPLPQASLKCTRWLQPSSLHRIPTPLKRCWMSHLQALSTIPEPSGTPSSLYMA